MDSAVNTCRRRSSRRGQSHHGQRTAERGAARVGGHGWYSIRQLLWSLRYTGKDDWILCCCPVIAASASLAPFDDCFAAQRGQGGAIDPRGAAVVRACVYLPPRLDQDQMVTLYSFVYLSIHTHNTLSIFGPSSQSVRARRLVTHGLAGLTQCCAGPGWGKLGRDLVFHSIDASLRPRSLAVYVYVCDHSSSSSSVSEIFPPEACFLFWIDFLLAAASWLGCSQSMADVCLHNWNLISFYLPPVQPLFLFG